MPLVPFLVTMVALAAQASAHAQPARRAGEPTFAHPRDIGPRYEPGIEQWWEDYKRTGCMPVPRAVRLPNGRYVVRTYRDCGGALTPRPR